MPINNRIAELSPEIAEWRRDIHAHPELLYEVHRTAALVAEKLREFGCDEVVTGIGRTGVVGIIKGRKSDSGRAIGLRADMDALPITEVRDLPYKSQTAGAMHACGHDGHTAMLLGAARYLAETRNFDGTVAVIFQPAEEGGAGGEAMVKDGMMERFGIEEVYGMHNMPGLPVGQFALRPGPIMAAADQFDIEIEGYGAHAAKPNLSKDPVVIGAQIVQALQGIVSRNVDPLESCVISVTFFKAGTAYNIIPQTAHLGGTIRTLSKEIRELAPKRIEAICAGIGAAHDVKVKFTYRKGYPVTANHERQAAFAASVARAISGEDKVDERMVPTMGGEDFSFMLEARPGAFIFVGNGDSAGLHHEEYDFNDDAIPVGVSYWAKLVETALPA